MLIVGLTGPIASGKSKIIDLFKEHNIIVCSDDDLIDSLYRDSKVTSSLQKEFDINSKDSYYPKIKSVIFSKVKKEGSFKKLENCLYPLLWKKRFSFLINSFIRNPYSICILEIPLLVEKKMHLICDYVIVTSCSSNIRKERAMQRPTMTEDRFKFVNKNQIKTKEKLLIANYVIDTSKDISLVKNKVDLIFKELVKAKNNINFINILKWRKYNAKDSI